MDLYGKIERRTCRVGIIGMGYVGLPLSRVFVERGFSVTGFDIDARKIELLQAGRSYIKHLPASVILSMRERGFSATDRFERLSKMNAIIVCVPTPLTETKEPDLSYIEKTSETIGRHCRRGQIVILESTTYPGTTVEIVKPCLEKRGFKVGRDIYLAFSPEREDPGNPNFSTEKIPKVVGADDPQSARLACKLYGSVVTRVVPVSSTAAAEAAKLLENIYRCVNIALVNELKILFDRMGIDVWEVIAAASTKPFGFSAFYPGPGLGGHCIPVDPYYLSWKAREYDISTRFIELAGEVNTGMPYYVVERIHDALDDRGKTLRGSRCLVLGAAYKKNVDDMRESPALKLMEILKGRGAVVSYNDPHISRLPRVRKHDLRLSSVPLTRATLRKQDCVIIATDHDAYDYGWIVKQASLVVDTRNATKSVAKGRRNVVKA